MDLPQTLDTFLITYPVGREGIESILRLSDEAWQVEYETGPALNLTLDNAGGRLALIAGLGTPPTDRKTAVFEALLTYSALWRATGGVRGALNGEGDALLIVELPLAEISESHLHRVMDNFITKARFLADYVAAGAPPASSDDQHFIRL